MVMALLACFLPGAGELVENAAHFVQHGHFAHSLPDGDTHGPLPAEHGCTGAVHLCACCTGPAALLSVTTGLIRDNESVFLAGPRMLPLPSVSPSAIYHPPRA